MEKKESTECFQVPNRIVSNEKKINDEVTKYLKEHGIAYIDMLPPMKRAAQKEAIYFNNSDGHPGVVPFAVELRGSGGPRRTL
jgi:hypothetical protein